MVGNQVKTQNLFVISWVPLKVKENPAKGLEAKLTVYGLLENASIRTDSSHSGMRTANTNMK